MEYSLALGQTIDALFMALPARKSYLKMLDPIHYQGIRLALGAFEISPCERFLADRSEPPFSHRRDMLSQIKIKPCIFDCFSTQIQHFI